MVFVVMVEDVYIHLKVQISLVFHLISYQEGKGIYFIVFVSKVVLGIGECTYIFLYILFLVNLLFVDYLA